MNGGLIRIWRQIGISDAKVAVQSQDASSFENQPAFWADKNTCPSRKYGHLPVSQDVLDFGRRMSLDNAGVRRANHGELLKPGAGIGETSVSNTYRIRLQPRQSRQILYQVQFAR
jgi:hypothetical protein